MGGAFSFAQGAAARGDPAAAPFLLAVATPRAHPSFRREAPDGLLPSFAEDDADRGPLFRARGEDAGAGSNEAQSLPFLLRYPAAGFNRSRASCGHYRAFTVKTPSRSHSVSFREVQ